LNVTRQAISKYERGDSFPDISVLILLAGIFGVTMDELIKSGDPSHGEVRILESVIGKDSEPAALEVAALLLLAIEEAAIEDDATEVEEDTLDEDAADDATEEAAYEAAEDVLGVDVIPAAGCFNEHIAFPLVEVFAARSIPSSLINIPAFTACAATFCSQFLNSAFFVTSLVPECIATIISPSFKVIDGAVPLGATVLAFTL
jgi:transcriptional regulator with XRE-family HTH domain